MSAAAKLPPKPAIERHTIAVLVDNEAGVLARVIGLFSGRGYNIESLTVAEVDHAAHTSRVTIVTSGTPEVIEQIEAQLGRLVPVHRVVNWTTSKPGIEREMALVKVVGTGEKRVEALRLSDAFRARVIDTTHTSFVFEITGAPDKIDAFVDLMRPLGLADVSRTGVAAISRAAGVDVDYSDIDRSRDALLTPTLSLEGRAVRGKSCIGELHLIGGVFWLCC
jgi:acetolactate synthase I/III small subunit